MLRSFVKQSLPDYMCPVLWIFLDELPLTADGKVDRGLLGDPTNPLMHVGSDSAESSVSAADAPRTPLEAQVASLYAKVVGVPTVGIHDNFFDLGGHSLTATQLIAKLREDLHVDISLQVTLTSIHMEYNIRYTGIPVVMTHVV